jgi:hypothetical protein
MNHPSRLPLIALKNSLHPMKSEPKTSSFANWRAKNWSTWHVGAKMIRSCLGDQLCIYVTVNYVGYSYLTMDKHTDPKKCIYIYIYIYACMHACMQAYLLPYLLTYSLTCLLTYSLTYSLTHLLTDLLTYLLAYSIKYLITSLLYSLAYLKLCDYVQYIAFIDMDIHGSFRISIVLTF